MRKSTAITYQMIKTSNRFRNLRALGLGLGALGGLGAGAAFGAQYLGSPEGGSGGEGFMDPALDMVGRAAATARGAGGSSMSDRIFDAIGNAKNEAMYSPVPSMASVLRDRASMGMFKEPTGGESFDDFSPSMSDRIFGLGRAGAGAAGRLGSMMDISGPPPSMSDRIFGLGRAGAGAAGRLGSMMDISGSPAPSSLSDRIFGLGRSAGRVAGAYNDAAGLMDPSDLGEWSPSAWQSIGDNQTMNRALARSIPRMPEDFATRGGGSAGLMSSVPAY